MIGKQKGFTLIETVIVMIVLGTLAAVAVPRYAGSKDKALVAAMKADLHSVALYEEQYAAENHGQYFSGTATDYSALYGFRTSKDVTVTVTGFNILGSQLADWTAVARHGQSTHSCELRSGLTTCTTDNSLSIGLFLPH
ncbi:MAG: prepilin-type N-terminal cleavage/methylation domain-containing protein [Gemmatimonadales bacterium]